MSYFSINRVVLVGRLTRDRRAACASLGHERLQHAHCLQLLPS